jgi:para-aminobenzoate synthetase component 1
MSRQVKKLNFQVDFKPNLASFPIACYLNSNNDNDLSLIAVGCAHKLVLNVGEAITELNNWVAQHKDWVFLTLGYDLKNEIEDLNSTNTDYLKFPALCAFIPEFVFIKESSTWRVEYFQHQEEQLHYIISLMFSVEPNAEAKVNALQSVQPKQEYLEALAKVKDHLQKGDIYQVNYCTAYYAEAKFDNPFIIYKHLNDISKAPFSGFFRLENYVMACGSPERFLKKEGEKLISQPIKGTAKLGENAIENEKIKQLLKNDPKERAENLMIVDLVRNDLSRIAEMESVRVEELCEVYAFNTVNQLISTVSCTVKADASLADILRATFPMGSMTGAPKVSAMQIAEKLEYVKRGWYSGALGYIKPNGDFDFNVIIRSVLYNHLLKLLMVQVGGGITIKSVAEKEYEECQIKAESMLKSLSNFKEQA